jgi:hypothetical protein
MNNKMINVGDKFIRPRIYKGCAGQHEWILLVTCVDEEYVTITFGDNSCSVYQLSSDRWRWVLEHSTYIPGEITLTKKILEFYEESNTKID